MVAEWSMNNFSPQLKAKLQPPPAELYRQAAGRELTGVVRFGGVGSAMASWGGPRKQLARTPAVPAHAGPQGTRTTGGAHAGQSRGP